MRLEESHSFMQASCSKLKWPIETIEADLVEKNCYSSHNSYSILKFFISTCGISIGLKNKFIQFRNIRKENEKKIKNMVAGGCLHRFLLILLHD